MVCIPIEYYLCDSCLYFLIGICAYVVIDIINLFINVTTKKHVSSDNYFCILHHF